MIKINEDILSNEDKKLHLEFCENLIKVKYKENYNMEQVLKDFLKNFLGIECTEMDKGKELDIKLDKEKLKNIIEGDIDKTIEKFKYDIDKTFKTDNFVMLFEDELECLREKIEEKNSKVKDRDKAFEDFLESNKGLLKEEIVNKTKQGIFKNESIKNKNNFKKNFKAEEIIKNEYLNYLKNYNEIKKMMETIFSYDDFARKDKKEEKDNKWNRDKFLSKININACPYCNRQYIVGFFNDKDIFMSADLDHYYPKSRYPFLALSIYNFIPSCQICNSRLKGSKDFHKRKHIYPYKECFGDDAKFRISNDEKNDIEYFLGNSNNFKIDIDILTEDNDLKMKIKNSKETFKLKDLYNQHKNLVKKMIKNSRIYNDSFLEELYEIFLKEDELFKSKESIKAFIFNNYKNEDDYNDECFSKLTKDIYEQLGIKFL